MLRLIILCSISLLQARGLENFLKEIADVGSTAKQVIASCKKLGHEVEDVEGAVPSTSDWGKMLNRLF